MSDKAQIVNIENSTASVSVDLLGGAIIDFHLHSDPVNPLSFSMPPESMPANNRSGVNYQGHFICLGRWGEPSEGEAQAGIPDHGQAAGLLWNAEPSAETNQIKMQVNTPLEGLHLNRIITLDSSNAVFAVREEVRNINPLGRMFNIVQHPTIAKPFLNSGTIVSSNAAHGYNYMLSTEPLRHTAQWPLGIMDNGAPMNLSNADIAYSSVFSYTVKKDEKYGWITAYSAGHNLLIGYLWHRSQYPWISFWQDFDGDQIRYRGLEFGTTGMHKTYRQIIEEGNHRVFGEDSYKYIDAGEMQSRGYISFLCKTPAGFTEASNVDLSTEAVVITSSQTGSITLKTTLGNGF